MKKECISARNINRRRILLKRWNKKCCCCLVASVVSDSVRPHRLQPTRLHHPWDSPGKNTGVGCHFLLQCMKWKVNVNVLSRVRLLATPWTAVYQPPLSMGFSRQEYCSGVPLPSPESLLGKPKKFHVEYEILMIQTIPFTLSDYKWSLGLSGMLGFFQAWGTSPAFWPQHSLGMAA